MYQNILQFIEKAWRRLISDESGSAIILALIIIAGLAGTGIGAARLARSNTQQTTLFEDSLKAFYASEAGVEAALLEWRFNHDVELWHKDNAKICADRVVAGGDTSICEQVILTRAVTLDKQLDPDDPVQDITSQIYDDNGQVKPDAQYPTNQPWYELRMYFRDPYEPVRGTFADPADPAGNPIKIEKDETVEIRFPDDDAYYVRLKWKPSYDDYFNDKIRLLWSPVVTLGGKEVLYDDLDKYGDPNSPGAIQDRQYFSDFYGGVFSYLKLFDVNSGKYNTGIKTLRLTAQVDPLVSEYEDGEKKGVLVYVAAFLANKSDRIHIPSNELTIEVVGHYNNISRSVEYTLDRQSGTVMDIFDYGVYSKEDLSK